MLYSAKSPHRLLFSLTLLCVSPLPQGLRAEQTPCETLLQNGNQAFLKKDYPQAETFFKKALEDQAAVGLYWNLAQTYCAQGKPAEAILSLERALCLSPRDPELQQRLSLLRSENGLKTPKTSPLESFSRLAPCNTWAYAFSLSVAVWMFFGIFKFSGRSALRLLASVGIALSLAGLAGYHELDNQAIVLHNELPLRVAPTPNALAHSTLKAGTSLKIQKLHNSDAFVTLPDGTLGWVAQNGVARVLG